MMKAIAFLFFLGSVSVFAQEIDAENYNIQEETFIKKFFCINGLVGFPSLELKKAINNNIGGTSVGLSCDVAFNVNKKIPNLFLGADFTYQTFGRDKINETATSPPLKTSYNSYFIGPLARLYIPTSGRFKPFIDGILGLNIFSARIKIDKDAFDTILNDEESELIQANNDSGLGYGIGIGFNTRKPTESYEEENTSFHFRIMYLGGDKLKYVKRGSVAIDGDGFVQYETGFTGTQILQFQIGLMLY